MDLKRLGRRFGDLISIPWVLAVLAAYVQLNWLVFNILFIIFDEKLLSAKTFEFLQRVHFSLGFFVLEVGDTNIQYSAIVIILCVVQFCAAVYFLWGVIYESPTKMKVWLVYNGMMNAIALLYFVQLYFIGSGDTLCTKSKDLFRIQIIRDLVSFACFNGFYTYQACCCRKQFRASNSTLGNGGIIDAEGIRRPAVYENLYRACVDFVAVAHTIVYGAQVVGIILYLSFVFITSINVVVSCSIDLALSLLALYFAYVLWQGNYAENNKKMFVWMVFQLVSGTIEYSWMMYTAGIGFLFDLIILRFVSKFLLLAVSIPVVSERIKEIGRSLEFRDRDYWLEPFPNEFGVSTVHLELQNMNIPAHM